MYSWKQLSRMVGVPVGTLRYWYDSGLLEEREGEGDGYLTDRHVDQAVVAKNAKRLGISGDELRRLADARHDDEAYALVLLQMCEDRCEALFALVDAAVRSREVEERRRRLVEKLREHLRDVVVEPG